MFFSSYPTLMFIQFNAPILFCSEEKINFKKKSHANCEKQQIKSSSNLLFYLILYNYIQKGRINPWHTGLLNYFFKLYSLDTHTIQVQAK